MDPKEVTCDYCGDVVPSEDDLTEGICASCIDEVEDDDGDEDDE